MNRYFTNMKAAAAVKVHEQHAQTREQKALSISFLRIWCDLNFIFLKIIVKLFVLCNWPLLQ